MADIECICDRDDCKQCWAARMDDTAEIVVTPVVPDATHDIEECRCPLSPLVHEWACLMETRSRSHEKVVTRVVHDSIIDPVDVPLIVPVPHGAASEPCS